MNLERVCDKSCERRSLKDGYPKRFNRSSTGSACLRREYGWIASI